MRSLCRSLLLSVWVLGCGAAPAGTPAPGTPRPDQPPDPVIVDAAPVGPATVRDATVLPPPAADTAAAADAPPPAPPAGGQQVTVAAGMFDRQDTIVSFPFAGLAKGYQLRDSQGATLPLQVREDGQAVFVLPSLKAGTQVTFAVEEAPAPAPAVSVAKEADGLRLTSGPLTVFRYQTTGKLPPGIGPNYLRGGYIHPLLTPAGVLVTDDYPGDHRHHHGIWSAWAHTTFEGRHMDFWNMGGGSAKVDFESLTSSWEGPVHAGFHARHLFTDLHGGPKTALNEDWVVTVYKVGEGAPAYFVFDLDSVQQAASASPVNLDQYLYGGFAFRGSAQWRAGATFLTSEGKDRGSGDGTTARWCYIGGRVDGKEAGYAVLGHPANFRAPQPMRINPTDPYFSFSPVKPGGFPIVQGKPYATRFRLVVVDGAPDKALFDRLWNDYATPPAVTSR
jgi:hypothetical protein